MTEHENADRGEPEAGAVRCFGEPDQHTKSGYFSVSLQRVEALIKTHGDAELLAAWLVARRFTFGPGRNWTEAGARAIATACGFGRHRAGILLGELIGAGLLRPLATSSRTSRTRYLMAAEPEPCAYLPSLWIEPGRPSLAPYLEHPAGPDALHLLLTAHGSMDLAGFGGCDPDAFPSAPWHAEGDGEDFGPLGEFAPGWWLAREGETKAPVSLIESFGSLRQFWNALGFLLERGDLVRTAYAFDGRRLLHPFFAYGERHREVLRQHDIVPDIARLAQRAAQRDLDAREQAVELVIAALDGECETEHFIVPSDRMPTIRTLFMPRLIAPTPENLQGLERLARLSQAVAAGF